jgi:hypothetical protein
LVGREEKEAKNTQSYFPYRHRQSPSPIVSIVTRSAVSNYLPKQLASSSSLFSSAIVVVFVAVVCCAKKKRRKEREGGKEGDMYVVVSILERVGGS